MRTATIKALNVIYQLIHTLLLYQTFYFVIQVSIDEFSSDATKKKRPEKASFEQGF
jgi:hypothetical protein